MSECEYMLDYLFVMVETVDYALQTEPETAQKEWLRVHSMSEKVTAIAGTEMRRVSPDALGEVAASLKLLVRRAEQALRTVNKAGESWPVDSLAVWAPDGGGPQIELQIDNPHNPHTPTPASIDAPPAATGDDSLHTRRIMVRWPWKDASVLHQFSETEAP